MCAGKEEGCMLEESHPQKRKEIREQKPDPEGRKRVQR